MTRTLQQHRRRMFAVVALAAACTTTAGWTAGSADAMPRWNRIDGDHHSPSVVESASVALGAFDTFSVSGTPGDFVAFLAARDATADRVAGEMRLDPTALRAAWSIADLAHQQAVLAALTQLGVPYRAYRADPGDGFDCSGLTSWAWRRAGVSIAHQSSSQINAARAVDEGEAVAGDLVQYPGHVMLYLGLDRAIVQAGNTRNDVELSYAIRDVRFGDPEG